MSTLPDLIRLTLAGNGEIVTQDTLLEPSNAMELAQHFDWGFLAGRDSVRLETQNEIRIARQRAWDEAEVEYRQHRRRFATTTAVVALTLVVMLLAIAYLGSLA